MGRIKVLNPPSIPSHMNKFGYDENEQGHLIKQAAGMIGFTGIADDKAGPGDYDPESGHKMLKRTSTGGVTSWKQPQEPPATIKTILDAKKRMPGPGQYEVKSA